uniref:Protein kinase domain-containing protein n=1 Tax=Neogobius melanostomus TaxID=47308 RepID=A0A8C6V325_9GOBI
MFTEDSDFTLLLRAVFNRLTAERERGTAPRGQVRTSGGEGESGSLHGDITCNLRVKLDSHRLFESRLRSYIVRHFRLTMSYSSKMKSKLLLNELEARGYKVCTVLNTGRSGVVYECVTGKQKESVAIKIPHMDHNNSGEAGILRYLNDKSNIVKCLGEIIHGDSEILVFEKLGVNLEKYIQQSCCMPITFIRDVVKQMGSALSALRRAGIIHADIKPSHIMTDKPKHKPFPIKLIDFGSALSTSDAKQGSTLGTIGFMSPEIMLGLPFTQATDVWSLGSVQELDFSRPDIDKLEVIGSSIYPPICS